jgi:polysaccharide export outer membrane protein
MKRGIALVLACLLALQPLTAATPGKNLDIDYTIKNGDVLSIIVYPADELGREVTVQPDGNIEINLIGSIKVTGLSANALARALEARLSAFVKNPQVSVIIKKFSGYQVFVTGAVRTTGAYDYHEGLKVMELTSKAGGCLDEAQITKIRVIRGEGGNKRIYVVNLDHIMNKGRTEKDIALYPGDVVFVPKSPLARTTWFANILSPWLSIINFFILIYIAADRSNN